MQPPKSISGNGCHVIGDQLEPATEASKRVGSLEEEKARTGSVATEAMVLWVPARERAYPVLLRTKNCAL